jgi:hypothetical protein
MNYWENNIYRSDYATADPDRLKAKWKTTIILKRIIMENLRKNLLRTICISHVYTSKLEYYFLLICGFS